VRQVEVSRIISRDYLRSVEIFENTSDHFLEAVSVVLDQEVYSIGDALFKADDICSTLYILATGTVQQVWTKVDPKDDTVRTHTDHFSAGSALGQLEFLFGIRYITSCHVVGTDDVRVFRLNKEDFQRIIKLYPYDEDTLFQVRRLVG
jgi:CRP-like cAMP-binding protein